MATSTSPLRPAHASLPFVVYRPNAMLQLFTLITSSNFSRNDV
jgi:hypothetical protein